MGWIVCSTSKVVWYGALLAIVEAWRERSNAGRGINMKSPLIVFCSVFKKILVKTGGIDKLNLSVVGALGTTSQTRIHHGPAYNLHLDILSPFSSSSGITSLREAKDYIWIQTIEHCHFAATLAGILAKRGQHTDHD
jgi:hypothetical protein